MPATAPARAPAVKLFRAFADPTRLRILGLLRSAPAQPAQGTEAGELCVCDLTAILRVPQPTASRHLGYLRRVGLVTCRREGAWCYYRLCPAAGPVHRRLLETLEACAQTLPEINADAKRLGSVCCSKDGQACC